MRSLIDSGTGSSLIKLRGCRLYLDSRLYGSASQTGFHKASTRSQPSTPRNTYARTPDDTIVSATALQDLPSIETESLVYSFDPSIYAVSETWLTPSTFDNEIIPSGYHIIFRLIISVVYIPSCSDQLYFDSLLSHLRCLLDFGSPLFILLEFNCPDIDWSTLYAKSFVSLSVCDIVHDHNLSQIIGQPTHTGNHTLDLVVTYLPDYLVSHQVYSIEFMYSDHFLINISLDFKLRSNPSQHPFPYGCDFTRGDFHGLVPYLLECDFGSCLNSVDMSLRGTFKHILLQACYKFIPKIKLCRHVYPIWFTKEICHQIKCIMLLRRKYKSCAQASTSKSLEYKISQLDAAIAKANEAYENDLIEQASSNPSPLFRHIR
uniref:Endonuclease/exonuclease/phosphatase domain-containing protein n=1 Tax=Amphimedon queenslandica TaxID=400682 RepID=A0A1X7TPG6_AMPQE